MRASVERFENVFPSKWPAQKDGRAEIECSEFESTQFLLTNSFFQDCVTSCSRTMSNTNIGRISESLLKKPEVKQVYVMGLIHIISNIAKAHGISRSRRTFREIPDIPQVLTLCIGYH